MFQKFLLAGAGLLSFSAAMAQTDTVGQSKKDLQELVISGIKVGPVTPITQITLKRLDIEQKYFGADIPSLIQSTPSINSYSDNGTGIGYSYFRLRGMDQSRVNHSINGIPLNDAETQGVFFNNVADLAASAEQIQIQRGIGLSGNGTASYAGSISILTRNLSQKAGVNISLGMGSFGSNRVTIELQSGMLGKFAFYGRLGQVETRGYRNNSGANVKSYQFTAGYFGKKSVLRFNVFGGMTHSQLSYNGIPKAVLDTSRTFNPLVNNERDAFNQHFFQLQYSKTVHSGLSFNTSAYMVLGAAPKFEYFNPSAALSYFNLPSWTNGPDTVTQSDVTSSYCLKQIFIGGFANVLYTHARWQINAGFHANTLSSNHYMQVVSGNALPPGTPANFLVYYNTGTKQEASGYARITYALTSKLNLFADLQLRRASFKYEAREMEIRKDNLVSVEPMSWLFFNPKVGANYQINKQLNAYVMLGTTQREPTRFDYLTDDLANNLIKQSFVKPEQVKNTELGVDYVSTKFAGKANFFYMDFVNQIAPTGVLNNFGYSVNANFGASFRRGLEIDFTWKLNKYLWLIHASSFSQNKIKSINLGYHPYALDTLVHVGSDTTLTFSNVNAALSPAVIINQGIRIIPTQWMYVEANGRYVSMQYLDNTQNNDLSIPAFGFLDLKASFKLEKWIKQGKPTLTILCNNCLDAHYSPAGNIAGYTNYMGVGSNGQRTIDSQGLYFPAAGRNFFLALNWKF